MRVLLTALIVLVIAANVRAAEIALAVDKAEARIQLAHTKEEAC